MCETLTSARADKDDPPGSRLPACFGETLSHLRAKRTALSAFAISRRAGNDPGVALSETLAPVCFQRLTSAAAMAEKYRTKITARDRFASTQTSAKSRISPSSVKGKLRASLSKTNNSEL
jgi:hypothetical protein